MDSSALGTKPQQSKDWRKWQKYSAMVLGILLVMTFLPSTGTILVLRLAAVILLSLAVKRPVFIVAAIVLVELTIAGYPPRLPGLPMNARYAVVFSGIALVLILSPLMKQSLSLGPGTRRVLIPAIIFVILSGISTTQGFTPELTIPAVRYYKVDPIIKTARGLN